MSTIKGLDCIRIQRYNESSNARHNAQPDMYQSRLHEALFTFNRVFNPCLKKAVDMQKKIMKKLSLLLEFEAF